MISGTWYKLKAYNDQPERWGVKIREQVAPGTRCEVVNKKGEVKTVILGKCVKSFDDAHLWEITDKPVVKQPELVDEEPF